MAEQFDNWGRWGKDDERGALNLLTPEAVVAAAGAVRSGRVVNLGLPIRASNAGARPAPHLRGRPLPQHYMNLDGGDYAAGARRLHGEMCLSDDTVIITAHGTSTHVDALAHAWRGDVLYNRHDSRKILSFGAARCGIDKMGGVVARGVLFDVAGHLGVPFLDESVAIGADLLCECLDASGQELRAGDVAVVRTGWPTVFETDEARYQGGQPGLAYDGARWLAEHDVCMIACDNSGIGQIAMDGTFAAPLDEDVHLLCLWERGIPLAEMLWLEELAEYGQNEFLFVLAPLTIVGGTASPVNPLAIL